MKIKIIYSGIGCNLSEEHTEEEFLNIMNKEFTNKNWSLKLRNIPKECHYQLKFKEWILPDDFILFTLIDWIEYSGADIVV